MPRSEPKSEADILRMELDRVKDDLRRCKETLTDIRDRYVKAERTKGKYRGIVPPWDAICHAMHWRAKETLNTLDS